MSTTAVVPKRRIGDATFSAIGYGAMGISVAYGPALPDEERFKVGRTSYGGQFVLTSPWHRSLTVYTRAE